MSQLEEIRERLDLCDKKIVSVLEERMDIIKEIMVYKKENGLPILQPEQEKRQRKMLLTHVDENTYKDEILDIFTYIVENSRRIQAKTLFTHNILLIGFMGAGKSTVSTYLSKILASPQVEMDEEIVKKEQEAQDLKRQYFGPEGELYKKRESLVQPIQDEIYNAVKEISEDKGYQLILDRASVMNNIIFASPKIDISNEVLLKLGYSK